MAQNLDFSEDAVLANSPGKTPTRRKIQSSRKPGNKATRKKARTRTVAMRRRKMARRVRAMETRMRRRRKMPRRRKMLRMVKQILAHKKA